MKMVKKFLAVALAGVLALSVLTGCGKSAKSKIVDSLAQMGIEAEQDKDMDKTAKSTLTAIEAIVAASAKDSTLGADEKITLDNAVGSAGKLIGSSGVMTGADTGSKVQTALGIQAGGENENKLVRVALVKTQSGIVIKDLTTAKLVDDTNAVNPAKLGITTTKDGKYMLVVVVNDISNT